MAKDLHESILKTQTGLQDLIYVLVNAFKEPK